MQFIDQLNRTVLLPDFPKRIVSLVPSQTELLADLSLKEEVCGITKFCVHPENWLKEKTIVGGTKQHRFEVIEDLQPDLIIANKEENTRENIEQLAERYPVWVSDVTGLKSALEMIDGLGKVSNRVVEAQEFSEQISRSFEKWKSEKAANSFARKRVLYLIWKDPYMAAGGDTFISEMLSEAGYENVLDSVSRYPQVSVEEMASLAPDLIFFSSEPFPFGEKHLRELDRYFPKTAMKLVDGELFSWYGSRLLKMPPYWKALRSAAIL